MTWALSSAMASTAASVCSSTATSLCSVWKSLSASSHLASFVFSCSYRSPRKILARLARDNAFSLRKVCSSTGYSFVILAATSGSPKSTEIVMRSPLRSFLTFVISPNFSIPSRRVGGLDSPKIPPSPLSAKRISMRSSFLIMFSRIVRLWRTVTSLSAEVAGSMDVTKGKLLSSPTMEAIPPEEPDWMGRIVVSAR